MSNICIYYQRNKCKDKYCRLKHILICPYELYFSRVCQYMSCPFYHERKMDVRFDPYSGQTLYKPNYPIQSLFETLKEHKEYDPFNEPYDPEQLP